MNGILVKDWTKFDPNDKKHWGYVKESLQYFMAVPNKFIPAQYQGNDPLSVQFRKEHDALQLVHSRNFATTAEFPASILPVIEKVHIIPDYDNGYEQIFDIRDYSGSRRNGFTVRAVRGGLTFNQVLVGEKLKVYQMYGDQGHCYFSFYGGALGWHRQLFDDEDYWTIEDNAIEFRNKAYYTRAATFYALIEAVGDSKGCCDYIAASCDDCDATARADAESINRAATALLVQNKDKGYGLNPATTGFIVLAPLHLRGRIRQALGVNLQSFQGSEKVVDFRFTQITSLMLTNNDRFYVILPKVGAKGGYRMDLTLFSDFDILSYTDTVAGWMRYGGCVVDTDTIQCVEVELASGSCPEASMTPGEIPCA
jgi:hypothetical protein